MKVGDKVVALVKMETVFITTGGEQIETDAERGYIGTIRGFNGSHSVLVDFTESGGTLTDCSPIEIEKIASC